MRCIRLAHGNTCVRSFRCIHGGETCVSLAEPVDTSIYWFKPVNTGFVLDQLYGGYRCVVELILFTETSESRTRDICTTVAVATPEATPHRLKARWE